MTFIQNDVYDLLIIMYNKVIIIKLMGIFKMSEGKKLLSKAFKTDYGLGKNVLNGWEASPSKDENDNVIDGSFLIKRHNGTEVTVGVGSEIPNVGLVSVDPNKNISVGKYTVIVGKNLAHDWRAKATRGKDTYLFSKKSGGNKKVKMGDDVSGLGAFKGKDEDGNLIVGEYSVPVNVKIRELKLLVYKTQHPDFKSGYQCHFNVIEPGNADNYSDGSGGVFFPAKGNQPAKFCEVDSDKKANTIAIFWPSRCKTFTIGKIRTIAEARTEKALLEKVKVLEAESAEFEINPEDNADYVQAKELLTKANNDNWESMTFTVQPGFEAFGLKDPKKESANSFSR